MSARSAWLNPARAPQAAALVCGNQTLSRSALAARADALAAWLAARGVGAGDVVAAHLPNGTEFATLLHAVDRRDAILLPLHRRQTQVELSGILHDAAPRVLLHAADAAAETAVGASRAAGVVPCAFPAISTDAPRSLPRLGTAAPALLLYTSGTTGQPKGAVLTHEGLGAAVQASAQHLGTRRDDRWLACLPFFHVGGLSILLRCARQAVACEVQRGFDAERVYRALERGDLTHISLVPTLLGRLLDSRGNRRAPPALRVVLVGGAQAPPALLERAAKLGWPVAATYGLTEAASQVATQLPSEGWDAGARLLPGVSVRIVDGGGNDAPAGEPGEILIRGKMVMAGYWRRPAATARTLVDGWLHTGDVGTLDTRGNLRVFDRRTDLLVSGGENVYPAQVEAVLLEHPDVLDAGVSGTPDPEYGNRPVAWVVPREKRELDAQDLARFCRGRLASYEVPVRFHTLPSLPRTASGKLQRQRLGKAGGNSWD